MLEKNKTLQISNLQPQDIPYVFALQDKYIAHPYSMDTMNSDIKTDRHHYFVAKIDDVVCGFVSIVDNIDSVDILQIVVDMKYRRMSVATHLMDRVKEYCKTNNISSIMLEVRCDNDAIKFYEKYGFKLIAKREKYYNDTDALIYQYLIR